MNSLLIKLQNVRKVANFIGPLIVNVLSRLFLVVKESIVNIKISISIIIIIYNLVEVECDLQGLIGLAIGRAAHLLLALRLGRCWLGRWIGVRLAGWLET